MAAFSTVRPAVGGIVSRRSIAAWRCDGGLRVYRRGCVVPPPSVLPID